MQSSKPDIGELARRNSIDVELEKEDEEYFVKVYVAPEEASEDYSDEVVKRAQTVEELGEIYTEHLADFPSEGQVTVYGNKESAVQSMVETDSWARFEAPSWREDVGESYTSKGWAVDTEPIIRGVEADYEDIADRIAAATLHVVNRAESEGEVGPDLQGLHYNLVRELGSEQDHLSEEETVEAEIEYDDLVSGSIPESKERIEEIEDELDEEDWENLLEAEKQGENRVTFTPYLEERLEEEREDT